MEGRDSKTSSAEGHAVRQHFPARLHVLLARNAPYGLILRRGPAKQVCTIGWNRAKDTFEVGQWMKATLYERKCDISPDGKHWIYFALNGRWSSETRGSYTAIARTPWLKAVSLWPEGDTWGGGGCFADDGAVYGLGNGSGSSFHSAEVRCNEGIDPVSRFDGMSLNFYETRLVRGGWDVEGVRGRPRGWLSLIGATHALDHGWRLRKWMHAEIPEKQGRKVDWEEHALEHVESGVTVDCPNWEWADLDSGSLVWAEEGCLYRGRIIGKPGKHRLEKLLLKDFNDMTFEPLVAPY